jgi:hypothetical protein
MIKTLQLISTILLLLGGQTFAQDSLKRKPLTFYGVYPWQGQKGYNVGLVYYNQLALDLGVLSTDLPKKNSKYYHYIEGTGTWIVVNQNIFINTELTYGNSNFIIAPKIGYEFNYVIFTARLNDALYFDFNNNLDNRLILEGGITVFGFGSLCYGYSIPTLKSEFNNISRHRVSLRINFFPKL